MAVLNYTTQISADKSVGEIQKLLATHGAKTINTDWDDGEIVALSFTVLLNNQIYSFRLPANVEGVLLEMQTQSRAGKLTGLSASKITQDQARRVAWRQLKDLVEAQMAFIQSKQATIERLMFAYMLDDNGRTIYEQFEETRLKALPAGK